MRLHYHYGYRETWSIIVHVARMHPPKIGGTNAIKIMFLELHFGDGPDTIFTVSAFVHRADDVRPTSTSDVTSNTESESDIVVDVNSDIQSVIVHVHTSYSVVSYDNSVFLLREAM